MKFVSFILIAFAFVFFSCAINKKGVFYKEMMKKPTIQVFDNRIVVKTDNSVWNSALKIYKIDKEININKRTIELKGFQAFGKKYRQTFELKLKNMSHQELQKYQFYWVDPDNMKTLLEIE